jgi:hypothetical protein
MRVTAPPEVPRYLRVAVALALGSAAIASASCGTDTNATDVTVGGALCVCPSMDGGSIPTSGSCTPDQLDAGCSNRAAAGPLCPPDLPTAAA